MRENNNEIILKYNKEYEEVYYKCDNDFCGRILRAVGHGPEFSL